jgi:hypothetical protein
MRIVILFILLLWGVSKDSGDWLLYPNPAKDYFCVEVKEVTLPSYVMVYDMNGRLVLRKYIGEDQMFARIEIMFRPGSYIVYLSDK